MSPDEANELLRSIETQRGIYDVMAKLTQRQFEVLAKGDTDEILELAQAKNDEMARIERINTSIAPLKERWQATKGGSVPAELRDRVEAAFAELGRVLSELIELEEGAEKRFHDGVKERGESLKKNESRRRVQQAYASGGGRSQIVDRSR